MESFFWREIQLFNLHFPLLSWRPFFSHPFWYNGSVFSDRLMSTNEQPQPQFYTRPTSWKRNFQRPPSAHQTCIHRLAKEKNLNTSYIQITLSEAKQSPNMPTFPLTGWWFQPIWKTWSSNWVNIFPNFRGENTKNIWATNHETSTLAVGTNGEQKIL